LIRPPRRHFIFSYIHGISWADVEAQPTFIEVWDQFAPFWKDAGLHIAATAWLTFYRNCARRGSLLANGTCQRL
jgi:hypothetical protein